MTRSISVGTHSVSAILGITLAAAFGACGSDDAGTPDTTTDTTTVTDTTPDTTVADSVNTTETSPEVVDETTPSDTVADPDTGDTTPGDTTPGDTGTDVGDTTTDPETTPPDPFAANPKTLRITSQYDAEGTVYQVRIGGQLFTAEPPSLYAEVDREGPCRLLAGANPFCENGCTDGLCTAPNVCTPWPDDLSAGTITVADPASAAKATKVEYAPGGYAWSAFGAVFAAGATLDVTAAGDALPGFTTTVVQPQAIALTNYASLDLDGAGPLTLTWTVPLVGAVTTTRVKIRLQEDRAQHGRAYPGVLECDVPDTGSFTIPERLRAAYANHDNFTCGKCPQSFLTRYEKRTVQLGDDAHTTVDIYAESEVGFLLTFNYPAP